MIISIVPVLIITQLPTYANIPSHDPDSHPTIREEPRFGRDAVGEIKRFIEVPKFQKGAPTVVASKRKKEGKYSKSKLYFLDDKGKEIKFTPGKIWVEIVEPYQEVKWETNQ